MPLVIQSWEQRCSYHNVSASTEMIRRELDVFTEAWRRMGMRFRQYCRNVLSHICPWSSTGSPRAASVVDRKILIFDV